MAFVEPRRSYLGVEGVGRASRGKESAPRDVGVMIVLHAAGMKVEHNGNCVLFVVLHVLTHH